MGAAREPEAAGALGHVLVVDGDSLAVVSPPPDVDGSVVEHLLRRLGAALAE